MRLKEAIHSITSHQNYTLMQNLVNKSNEDFKDERWFIPNYPFHWRNPEDHYSGLSRFLLVIENLYKHIPSCSLKGEIEIGFFNFKYYFKCKLYHNHGHSLSIQSEIRLDSDDFNYDVISSFNMIDLSNHLNVSIDQTSIERLIIDHLKDHVFSSGLLATIQFIYGLDKQKSISLLKEWIK